MRNPASRSIILAIPFLATVGLGCTVPTDADESTAEVSTAQSGVSHVFVDTVNKLIPETRTGLVRVITVGENGTPKIGVVETINIEVVLSRNWRREIVLTLKSPSGTAYELRPVGVTGIKKVKVAAFAGEKANGPWTLEAIDTNKNRKRAVLDSWKLRIRSKPAGCRTDADCAPEERCEGATNCPPGAYCILSAQPGQCVPDTCTSHAQCGAGEYCTAKQVQCPPGAYCVLSVVPGTCEPIPGGRCFTHADCKPEDDCFGTMSGAYLGDCIPKGATCDDQDDCGVAETCDRHMHGTPPPGVYPVMPQFGTCQPIPCQSHADCKAIGPGWTCKGMTADHPVGQCSPQIYYILPHPGSPAAEEPTTMNDVEDNVDWLRAVERRLG
jgi:subtilisin-like proprotein convertase family protein